MRLFQQQHDLVTPNQPACLVVNPAQQHLLRTLLRLTEWHK
jgi:hypothetical protein